jgi:hypothetical protein
MRFDQRYNIVVVDKFQPPALLIDRQAAGAGVGPGSSHPAWEYVLRDRRRARKTHDPPVK